MHARAFLLLTVSLGGCNFSQIPTLKEYGDAVVGKNIAVIRDLVRRPTSRASQTGWQEKTYLLPNGHWVYVEPDRPNCESHYEVNNEDIIVGYTPVGTGCRYQ